MEHEPMHKSEYLKVKDDTGKQWTIPTSLLEKLEGLDRKKELLIFDPETLEAEKAKVILNEAIDAKIFSKFKRQFRYAKEFSSSSLFFSKDIRPILPKYCSHKITNFICRWKEWHLAISWI